uniref:Uncharacterized protein n=1 Tax=Lotharella oceanica TaxID=641309 RepID=A0A7S2X7I1_9EUKA
MADSSEEFSVKPKKGILKPEGEDPTRFVVTFSPREYGKAPHGTLVIRTSLMQWTYKIKGVHPKYVRPQASSTIRGLMDARTKRAPTKARNAVRDNIKAVKTSTIFEGRPRRAPRGLGSPQGRR